MPLTLSAIDDAVAKATATDGPLGPGLTRAEVVELRQLFAAEVEEKGYVDAWLRIRFDDALEDAIPRHHPGQVLEDPGAFLELIRWLDAHTRSSPTP